MNTNSSAFGKAAAWLLAATLLLGMVPLDVCACENRCGGTPGESAPHACCQQETETVSACCTEDGGTAFRSTAPSHVCACAGETAPAAPTVLPKVGGERNTQTAAGLAAILDRGQTCFLSDSAVPLRPPGESKAPPYLTHCAFRC